MHSFKLRIFDGHLPDASGFKQSARDLAYALVREPKVRAHANHELCPNSHESCLKVIDTCSLEVFRAFFVDKYAPMNSCIASSPCNIACRYFEMYSILKIFDLFRFRGLVARVVASTRSTRHHKIKRWRVKCAFADLPVKVLR